MPGRTVHVAVGAAAGLIAASYCARNTSHDDLLLEMIGGVVGGVIGGALPDLLEPALTPRHRQAAHSILAGGGLMLVPLAEIQASCRISAERSSSRAARMLPGSPEWHQAEANAYLWRLLSGVVAGLIAGYASHLTLDAATPSGLPLLVR